MPDKFNAELGIRIRDFRQGKMTQAELAQRVGMSRTSITNVECGRQRLLVDQLAEIASVLSVPLTQLIPAPQDNTQATTIVASELNQMPTVKQWLSETRESTIPR